MIISIISRILFAAYFLEAGFVLIVAPWRTAFWDRNFFIERLPFLENLLRNVFVRGAVSGMGFAYCDFTRRSTRADHLPLAAGKGIPSYSSNDLMRHLLAVNCATWVSRNCTR